MRRTLFVFTVSSFLLSNAVNVFSHDLSKFGDWTKSLKQPDKPNSSCCGPADAHWVDTYEPSKNGFRALVHGIWLNVPAKKVIWDRVNPTGRGVIFVSTPFTEDWSDVYIYCFVPGNGV